MNWLSKAIASIAIVAAWAFTCTTEWGCVATLGMVIVILFIWDS